MWDTTTGDRRQTELLESVTDAALLNQTSNVLIFTLPENYSLLLTVFCTLGIVGNVLNLIVFCKLGFRDAINISLLALTVSDIGSLLTLQWMMLCYYPPFFTSDLPFDSREIENITGSWPRICFIRVTGFVTAYFTIERCVCIALPLQVKHILTPSRTFCVNVFIYLFMIASVLPIFPVTSFVWRSSPLTNRTILGLRFEDSRDHVASLLYALNSFYGLVTFVIIILATSVLVVQLNRMSKWRQKSAPANQTQSISTRDRTVTKMVTLVSTAFIVCFSPGTVSFVCTLLSPEFRLDGQYKDVLLGLVFSGEFLETVYSCTTFIIYLNTSSKFRNAFMAMIVCTPQKPKKFPDVSQRFRRNDTDVDLRSESD
ncbi:neuromedin-U receptor 2-like [Physella acuta]|uniref:neuromedin-U receptor 2-like n=1 Tax=Physella acuta TaxID=109671 RepID=UPI0027DDC416|nr:neuromedin-U receptor 2-like [Physella acuta]